MIAMRDMITLVMRMTRCNPSSSRRRLARTSDSKTGEVQTRDYPKFVTVPAIVTERPGRTHQKVVAPITGVVTGMNVVGNEMVESGTVLFHLRLTHEDLVKAQTEFLTLLGRLDVERAELARLEKINTGIVARKVLLERQYEIDKLESVLKAHRHSLSLHGLEEKQVEEIVNQRHLIREMQVIVPFLHADSTVHSEAETPHSAKTNGEQDKNSETAHDPHTRSKQFVISQLKVHMGEAVETGQTLCVLTDYSQLYLEGRAFEQDGDDIIRAANADRVVSAFPEQPSLGSPSHLEHLEIEHIANEIERESRVLPFYVNLPNQIVRESQRGNHKFVTWQFKPGQRMQVRVQVEQWEKVIVLPVDAIAQEGLDYFVFVENGDHFDRREVHILFRDQHDAVIANDGSLFLGETVALNSAHQLQIGIKNKSGGAVDPHAGHTH